MRKDTENDREERDGWGRVASKQTQLEATRGKGMDEGRKGPYHHPLPSLPISYHS